jgi:hydrogenase/urease accessory protein HupE
MCRLFGLLVAGLVGFARIVSAHPAPFSYVDLRLRPGEIELTLVAHAIDVAHELGGGLTAEAVLDPAVAGAHADRLFALLAERLIVTVDGRRSAAEPRGLATLPERQALKFHWRLPLDRAPGRLTIRSALFPYDENHRTFLNVYEGDALVHQAIFDRTRLFLTYYPGTPQGRWAVVSKFLLAGIHHIVIGPDHVLFLIGLLLLGGRLLKLVTIVTAFTAAHSVTLSLAALDLVTCSPRLVEPAIALSIVYVGADNLLASQGGRDVRPWVAFAFGLVHGFGFAGVLKEMELPRRALGWSLGAFNVGVELGQLGIVLVVASLVLAVRRRSDVAGRRLARGGSVVVLAAGAYWFVERVFFAGGAV